MEAAMQFPCHLKLHAITGLPSNFIATPSLTLFFIPIFLSGSFSHKSHPLLSSLLNSFNLPSAQPNHIKPATSHSFSFTKPHSPMEPEIIPKFRCFPHKGLKLSLPRLKSKSSSNSSSPRSLRSPIRPKNARKEEELREVFRRFDNDNDGKISAIEIRSYFGSIGEYMSHEEAKAIIDELDGDGDEMINFGDFMRLMNRDEDGEEDEDLKAAFGLFEFEKGCGRITPKSLQRVLSRLGESRSYDECAAMIRVFDIDGNGELDFHEFHQMMA